MGRNAAQRLQRRLEREQAERVTGIPAHEEDVAIVNALARDITQQKNGLNKRKR